MKEKFYTVDFEGFKAELPVLPLPSGVSIAFFNLHGDSALTEHCAKLLAEKLKALPQPTIRVPQGSKNITINISRGRTGNCFTKPTLSVSTLRARLLPIAPPRTA